MRRALTAEPRFFVKASDLKYEKIEITFTLEGTRLGKADLAKLDRFTAVTQL